MSFSTRPPDAVRACPEPGGAGPLATGSCAPGALPPFELAVATHGEAVFRVCRAVLGDADAEDACAETFIAALRAYPSLRPDSDIRAWLVTIAHHKAVDSYRAARRRATPVGEVPEPGRRGAGGDLGDGLSDAVLLEALSSLSFHQRAAVAYRYLADLSYADVARLLDTSEAAARRAASSAIAALRRSYRPEEPGDVPAAGNSEEAR